MTSRPFIVGLVFVAGSVATIHELAIRRRVRKRLSTRPPLSPEQFAQQFYPEHAAIAARVREILQNEIEVDISGARPTDSFLDDLEMGDSMSTVELVMALEKEWDITIQDTEAEKAATIDSLVILVIGKVEDRAAPQKASLSEDASK